VRRTLIALLVALVFGALVAPSSRGWDYWAPRLGPAINYAESRQGSISFAVVDELGKVHGYRRHRTVPAASVFKVMLMTAYLRQDSVRTRTLNNSDKSLLGPMITFSDNASASRINNMLGAGPINRLARSANMRNFQYVAHPWGLTRVSAADQARFMFRLERYIPKRHERYARYLLSHIVKWQRWGIAQTKHPYWRLFFKSGWGTGTGRVDHQVAFLKRRDGKRIAVAIMTEFSPDHAYGKRTLRGVAARLLADLP
jgi:Beta-lactamase enzyme family